MELDANLGRALDAIRAEAPNTIVIHTADNGAWMGAFPSPYLCCARGWKIMVIVPGLW